MYRGENINISILEKCEAKKMGDFFLYETDFTKEAGFKMFGFCHFVWLSGIVLFIWFVGKWYNRQPENKREQMKRILGIVFVVISLFRDSVLMITGHFDVGFLPLHLCGMALWIAALYAWTNNRFLGIIYVLLCVPGAVGALLFPDWTVYPFWNYMHVHAFISHGLIVAFGVWLFWSREIVPKWKELWMPLFFGIAGFCIIYPINQKLGTNYWFLNFPSEGSPLVWIYEITGTKWYLAGYFLLCSLIVVVWQMILSKINERREDGLF